MGYIPTAGRGVVGAPGRHAALCPKQGVKCLSPPARGSFAPRRRCESSMPLGVWSIPVIRSRAARATPTAVLEAGAREAVIHRVGGLLPSPLGNSSGALRRLGYADVAVLLQSSARYTKYKTVPGSTREAKNCYDRAVGSPYVAQTAGNAVRDAAVHAPPPPRVTDTPRRRCCACRPDPVRM